MGRRAPRDSRDLRWAQADGAAESERRRETPLSTGPLGPQLSPPEGRVAGPGQRDGNDGPKPVGEKVGEDGGSRPTWSSSYDAVASAASYSIGLGSVFVFPRLVWKHGGSFYLAHAVAVLLVSLPLYVLESGLGQFHSRGPSQVLRNLCPLAEGLGWAVVLLGVWEGLAYQASVAQALLFAGSSLDAPWGRCENSLLFPEKWNSRSCFTLQSYGDCVGDGPAEHYLAKGQCLGSADVWQGHVDRLAACVRRPAELFSQRGGSGDGTLGGCAFSLRLLFNFSDGSDENGASGSLADFFRLGSVQSPPSWAAGDSNASQIYRALAEASPRSICGDGVTALLHYEEPCSGRLVPAPIRDGRVYYEGPDTGRPPLFHLLLDPSEERRGAVEARARCLHQLLRLSRFGMACERPDKPEAERRAMMSQQAWDAFRGADGADWRLSQLACVLRRHCAKVWPTELLSAAACTRRLLDNRERSAAQELHARYQPTSSAALQAPEHLSGFPPELLFSAVLTGAALWLWSRRGIRELGRMSSWALGLPLGLASTGVVVVLALNAESLWLWDNMPPCRLGQLKLWRDAVGTSFYGLGIGRGVPMTLASYRDFRSDFVRDSILIVLADTMFRSTVGMCFCGLLQLLSAQLHSGPERWSADAADLVFSALGQALGHSSVASLLVFATVAVMGLASHIYLLEMPVTAVLDCWPELRRRRAWVVLGVVVVYALAGLPFLSFEGSSLKQLVEEAAAVPGLLVSLLQLILVSAVYGPNKLLADFRTMLGGKRRRSGERSGGAEGWESERSPAEERGSEEQRGAEVEDVSEEDAAHLRLGQRCFPGLAAWYLVGCWCALGPLALVVILMLTIREQWVKAREAEAGVQLLLLLAPVLLTLVVAAGAVYAVWRRRLRGWGLLRERARWGPALWRHRRGRYARRRRSSAAQQPLLVSTSSLSQASHGGSSSKPLSSSLTSST